VRGVAKARREQARERIQSRRAEAAHAWVWPIAAAAYAASLASTAATVRTHKLGSRRPLGTSPAVRSGRDFRPGRDFRSRGLAAWLFARCTTTSKRQRLDARVPADLERQPVVAPSPARRPALFDSGHYGSLPLRLRERSCVPARTPCCRSSSERAMRVMASTLRLSALRKEKPMLAVLVGIRRPASHSANCCFRKLRGGQLTRMRTSMTSSTSCR